MRHAPDQSLSSAIRLKNRCRTVNASTFQALACVCGKRFEAEYFAISYRMKDLAARWRSEEADHMKELHEVEQSEGFREPVLELKPISRGKQG
jgi:hypothetical protein